MSVKAILAEQQKSYTKAEEDALLATKQNTLTFDTTPTASSTNPVTSGGIATALDGRLPSPENAGAVGQVLTKTATGSVWQTQSSGGDIVAAASNSYAVTLYAASWSSQQQTIAVPSGAEITSTSDGVLGLAAGATQAQVEAFQLAKIIVVSQSSSGVVVKAYGIVPTINLPCELMLFMKADYYNKDYIDTYMAPLDTPTFIGTPKAPTAAAGTNTTQIATTAFVEQAKKTRVPVYGLGKNLLDNAYFIGGGSQQGGGQLPINQRGQTSYQTASAFSIDRWRIQEWNTTARAITLNSGNIEITGSASGSCTLTIWQNIENGVKLAGKTITASVLCGASATGRLFIRGNMNDGMYGSVPLVPSGLTKYTITLSDSITGVSISIGQNGSYGGTGNTDIQILAVKLELGTEQTLCHNEGTDANPVWVLNEVPDYEYELYRCITSTADLSDTFANKTLATGEELAYVENSTTASRTYAIGEYFCWHGLLYRAKTAISSGDTFTVNTNCEQVTEGGLNDAGVYGTNETLSISGVFVGLSNINGQLITLSIITPKHIPTTASITYSLSIGWVRGEGVDITDGVINSVTRTASNTLTIDISGNGLSVKRAYAANLFGSIMFG